MAFMARPIAEKRKDEVGVEDNHYLYNQIVEQFCIEVSEAVMTSSHSIHEKSVTKRSI